jgi:choline dehydrogenase
MDGLCARALIACREGNVMAGSTNQEEERYDYVVVGAGSAGCIVAAELADDPSLRVLLLEAGEPAEANPETLAADGYKQAFINPRLMWERLSVPQPGCAGHRLFLGSGRGVGGSGAINAMVYTRGDALDYDGWGLDGWRWRDLVPHFERVEERLRIRRLDATAFTEACVAAAEANGFRRKLDLNDGALSGHLGYEWMNMEGGERRHSYAAFLRPRLGRPNLAVCTRACVHRIEFDDGPRARAVVYRAGGELRRAAVDREVVLCAGALETPRLLLLSGVGPAAELRAHGIPVVADRAGVGRNLMDHPNVSVFFRGGRPTDCRYAQLYGFHRVAPASPLPPAQADTCYVFYSARSSFREGAIRLLPAMVLPAALYRVRWIVALLRACIIAIFALPPVRRLVERMYGIVVILGKPKSRGTVRLASADPEAPALVDPAYFAEADDLDALRSGVRLARRIAEAPALAAWGNRELIPGARAASDAQIDRFIQRNAMTTYHYAGTCRMGDDAEAVVDTRLRLRGVRGVRVADASVIPSVPVSAMNAPSMMIGWRAARFIAEERAAASRGATESATAS